MKLHHPFILSLHLQFLNDNSLEATYKEFDCYSHFIAECKRRASGQCPNIGTRRCRAIFCLFTQNKQPDGAENSTVKLEKYNSVLNSFEEAAEITLGDRVFFEVILHKNKIYVLGGFANGVILNSVRTIIIIEVTMSLIIFFFCSENC